VDREPNPPTDALTVERQLFDAVFKRLLQASGSALIGSSTASSA
jgi:hypothetical protein